MFNKKSVSGTFLLTKKNKIIIGNKHNITISKSKIFCNNTNLYSYNLFT
jgi:hypothetical protein